MRGLKLVVAVIGLTLFAASCKNNMELTKRHYTKGYYFHKAKSVDQQEVQEGVASQSHKEKATEMESVKPALSKNTTNEPEVKERKDTPVMNAFAKNETKKAQGLVADKLEKKEFAQNKKAKSGTITKQKNKKSKGGNSDANLILLVILCLFPFINLIPVYIHDGHDITTNFWITLLLNFLLIGGIIFSLLVVLDVVDLA